ncbi:hypothetical protein [Streptomyces sp. NPDC060366]|uniref:hypothetical protein n=1 Tax=Streptomyces sp. NPDC060366 TaxID=3347105 RepID=UPI003668A3E6
MDGGRSAYEQTYRELLEVVARLDILRRHDGGGVEPLANSAMYAASHAAWSLLRTLRPGAVAPVFADRGDKYLELAREWSAVGAPPWDATYARRLAVRACPACDQHGWVEDDDDDNPLRRCAHPDVPTARAEDMAVKSRVPAGGSLLDP